MGFLGFIGDALNDILGGNSSRRDQQRYNLQNMEIQQQYTLENMALQNQYNIEAFERENEYNSPLAQMQRLRQAGINPNWTSEGTAIAQQDSGVASSSPTGAMPAGQNAGGLSDLIQIGSVIKDLKVKQSEIDLNKALTKKARSDSFKAETEGEGQSFLNWLNENYGAPSKETEMFALNAKGQLDLQNSEQVFELAAANINKMLAERENIDINTETLKKALPYIVPEIMSRLNLNTANTYLANQQGRYVPMNAQSSYMSAQGAVMSGQAALGQVAVARERNQIEWKLADSITSLQASQARNFDEDTFSKNLANTLSSWAYDNGYSQKAIKQACKKASIEIKNLWLDYYKKYPSATVGRFFDEWEKGNSLTPFVEKIVWDIKRESGIQ